MNRRQPSVSSRKTPIQQRSRATVEAIFGATARILKKQGIQALTTNAIATQAGVSIGSLYEYFPNKEAILVEMACRILEADEAHIHHVLLAAGRLAPAESIRLIVHTLLEVHRTEPEVRRVVMGVHGAAGLRVQHFDAVQRLASTYAELAAARPQPRASSERIYVAVRAVLGAIRAALEERSAHLNAPQFEDELVRMLCLVLDAA